ncbi:MAG: hypothetical protein JJ869_05645 [Marivita sp.]|uniref:metallophosphoesterase n=1 Tax=Marivita sp. TaxID=2003365 RepID=UPI001B1B13AB|nr:metallophosphoesterase [Marivita sp.]MBO6883051.1 hypothetical protein [Marivita sp.]
MTSLTIIPDIHADPTRLHTSLDAATGSNVAFLGDFIDAGNSVDVPDDASVLRKVRSLVDHEGALAVMGNHELNAILFHRRDNKGAPLRQHSSNNVSQHASFLDNIGFATPSAIEWTEWFLSIPLWIELEGLNLVHACWDQIAIEMVKERRPDGRLTADDLEEVAHKESEFAMAVEMLTSGPEVMLPDNFWFYDYKGVKRNKVRLAWWKSLQGSWRDLALAVPDVTQLPDTSVSGTEGITVYGEGKSPVLVGHYKMKGEPLIESEQAACLDYPEKICIYHWVGEKSLSNDNIEVLKR